MLRIDRLTLVSLTALLALSGAACGLSSSLDDIFADSGGTGASGTGADGGGGSGGSAGGSGGAGAAGGSGGAVTTGSGGDVTTGTGGSTTSTGGSTMTGTGVEDCLDGADNDGDGDTDCADSECSPDFECVPPVPAGWQGHFHVSRTDHPTPPPACDGGSNPAVFFAGPAGPAECSACSCGALQGATCSAPQLSCWAGSTSCSGSATDWTPALADGQCHKPGNLLGFSQTLSCSITAPSQVIDKGSCAPSGVDFPNKETWQNQVGACDLPEGGGCGGAQACVPKAAGAPAEALCISKAGDVDCPAGPYSQKAVTFTGGTDERSCSACTCGDGDSACNGGSYTVYDPDQCGNNGNENPATISSASCQNVSSLLDFGTWSMKGTLPQPQGACPPDGGSPQGQVQVDGPVTFCCQP